MTTRRCTFATMARAVMPGVVVTGVVVTGLLVGVGPVAGAAGSARSPASVGPSTVSAPRPTDVLTAGSKGPKGPAISLDWAGYAVTGTALTSAAGSWTQPAAHCTGTKASQSAFWVGVDGYASTDPTVQQIGTDADCTKGTRKVPSAPRYYAWYELYPDAIVPLDTANHPVAQGDSLSASVVGSGSSFTLTLTDAGRWTFSSVQVTAVTPMDASAEWIAEAPSSCKGTKCTAVSLTDFGSVTFSGISAGGQPVDAATLGNHQITMTKNKKGTIVKASTSALTGGSGFTVTWVRL
jgi:hypothetical protein